MSEPKAGDKVSVSVKLLPGVSRRAIRPVAVEALSFLCRQHGLAALPARAGRWSEGVDGIPVYHLTGVAR